MALQVIIYSLLCSEACFILSQDVGWIMPVYLLICLLGANVMMSRKLAQMTYLYCVGCEFKSRLQLKTPW